MKARTPSDRDDRPRVEFIAKLGVNRVVVGTGRTTCIHGRPLRNRKIPGGKGATFTIGTDDVGALCRTCEFEAPMLLKKSEEERAARKGRDG